MEANDQYLDVANQYWQDGCGWGLAMGAITGGVNSGGGSSGEMAALQPNICRCEAIPTTDTYFYSDYVPYTTKTITNADGSTSQRAGYYATIDFVAQAVIDTLVAGGIDGNITKIADTATVDGIECRRAGARVSINGNNADIFIEMLEGHGEFTCEDGTFYDLGTISNTWVSNGCRMCVNAPEYFSGVFWEHVDNMDGNETTGKRFKLRYKTMSTTNSIAIKEPNIQGFAVNFPDTDTCFLYQSEIGNRYFRIEQNTYAGGTAQFTRGFNPPSQNKNFYGAMLNVYTNRDYICNSETGIAMLPPLIRYGDSEDNYEYYYPEGLGQLFIDISDTYQLVTDLINGTKYVIKRYDYCFVILATVGKSTE